MKVHKFDGHIKPSMEYKFLCGYWSTWPGAVTIHASKVTCKKCLKIMEKGK
jgi:hypothetical protein